MSAGGRQIVVGYDGSETSREAVRAACGLAGPDSVVTVVHAYELPPEISRYPFFEDFEQAWRSVAQEVLDSARDCARHCGGEVRFELASGRPAEVLSEMARERDAQFIVVGSRGPAGPLRAAIGSVTNRLLHRAGRPVLVVPEPKSDD
jgi:nucleotide-binding universal stress UspA family protein